MNPAKSGLTFASVDLSFHVHATEDEERVFRTVTEALTIPVGSVGKTLVEGHYGNPIIVFRGRLHAEEANRFAQGLLGRLTEEDRKDIVAKLESHLDEHDAFYLRLSKQLLLAGQVKVSNEDPVRIKLKPKIRFHHDVMTKLHAELLDV